MKWFRKAAEQNLAEGQCILGASYSLGKGVTKDNSEAVKWFHKAALQNNASAQFCLGYSYAEGEGVVTNFVEAYKWISLAAEQGNEVAKEYIGDLESKLTPEQITEGKKRTTNFKASIVPLAPVH